MIEKYDEINKPFKLQAQHLFMATSSDSDESSTNMNKYASVTNNKMLYLQQMFQSKKNQNF